jgi:hypothetical protein
MGNPRLRLFLVLILAAVLLPITISGCEHFAPFCIVNDTDKVLSLFVYSTTLDHIPQDSPRNLLGDVKPGKECKPYSILGTLNTYVFEAIDAQGNAVYSKVFTRQELEKMNWEVVITEE